MSTEQIKVKKNRSSSYPFIDLEQAIELMDKLTKSTGKGPYSRDAASLGIGHPKVTGPSAMKIATMVHFGLLSRSGNVYSRTQLADKIQNPVLDSDRKEAIGEAIRHPKLYKALINEYLGQSLPTLLTNILIRTHNINERVADKVARNFKKSLEYSGLLVNGVLASDQDMGGIETDVVQTSPTLTGNVSAVNHETIPQLRNTAVGEFTELPSGIKIQFPDSLKYNLALGDFSEGIKKIEESAVKILGQNQVKGNMP